MEKITYLVANYNNGKYIKDCIDSLKQQSNDNWLSIIIDDGSTDDSLEVITHLLNDQVTLLINRKNTGYIVSLKKVIDSASTDIVAKLDADDALYPHATACVLGAFAKNPDVGLVYSKYDEFDAQFNTCVGSNGIEVPPDKTSLQKGFISHLLSFRVSAYQETSGLDETMLYAEDQDLIYKLEEVTRPVFINQPLYKYRLIKNSQSHALGKYKLGLLNSIKAQNNALKRRNIHGFEYFFYGLLSWMTYCLALSKPYPKSLKQLVLFCLDFLHRTDLYFGIRTTGTLRRPRL